MSFAPWSLWIEGEFANNLYTFTLNYNLNQNWFNLCFSSSMLGSEESTTNYPGKIPSGLDKPSDAVDENVEKQGV